MAIGDKPFRAMKKNTSKERSFYTQGQQFTARVLCIAWLLAIGSPESTLATPKRQMVPATTTSAGDLSLASTISTPVGILQLSPDAPDSFWGDSAGSSPSIDAAPQERMSQEAAPFRERELLRTSPKVTSVSEHFPFEARGGESVRFFYQMGQWRAEVSSQLGAFSRRAVLPVVCSQGADVTSSLKVLSKYPSWYSQRQIHVLGGNVCPTLGEVVYVGELGLKGGGGREAQGGEQQGSEPPLVEQLRSLASNPQIDQQPAKLAELGAVLLKLAKTKQEEQRASAEDLSPYTEAAILYQHVLSICAQKNDQKETILASEKAKELADSAYLGLAQIQASMLAQAKGVASQAVTVEEVQARISADKQRLEAIRTKAREEVKRLAAFRDQQGSAEEVLAAEAVYIEGSKKLFADIAEASKNLLANFYQEAEAALGPAPCKYAVMGLGSMALKQITPYSDLEFAILMEDAPDEATAEASREYFRKLTHLVHFRVINLGETVLPFSEYKVSLDHLGRKGLNFDLGGKTPLGRKDKAYELIQPVAGMMEYLKNEDNKMEQMDKLLPFVLERTCYIYGAQGLHNDYLEAQRAFWSSCQDAAGKHAYQERMMKVLLKGMTELDHSQKGEVKAGRKQAGNLRTVGPKLHPEDAGRLYDVKQEIYRLPDRLLYGLATYYGLRPESAWDAVEQLQAQGIIGVSDSAKQAAHRLKYAVSFATMLRLATYIRYGEQKETLAGSASSEDAFSELFALPAEALQEYGSLFKYYYTALALHSEMNGFFKILHLRSQIQSDRDLHRMLSGFSPGGKYAAGQEKAYFSSFGFYDTSCAAKLAIYNRLLRYEEAAKCAEAHLEAVKQGYDQKKLARAHHNLGVSYYHLGKFNQSFDHFRSSLALLQKLYPDGHRQVAKVLRSLGIAYYNLSEFEQSLSYFEQSLKMLQEVYQENNPETAQALGSVGDVYEQLESFEVSLKYKQEALKMLQALYTDSHPEVARTLRSVGDAYADLGKFEESLERQEASLAMFKALGNRLEIARSLLSVGDAYGGLGEFQESLEKKQDALEMLQALYGKSHPEVARALLSLGESYALSGKLEESEDLKEQSWKMFQALYREDHPEVVRALASLNETRGSLIQDAGSSRQDTGPALRPLRTVHPQHLSLLFTPRHGKEAPRENTKLREYYRQESFACVQSLFEEDRPRHVKGLECQLMLLEQKLVKQDKEVTGAREDQIASHHIRLEEVKTPIGLQDLFKDRSVRPDEPVRAVQRILLIGDPGTDKTALSRQLAYQWSVGAWGQEFHTLYLLPVRSLRQSEYDGTRYNREKTLATAIVNNCFAHELPATEGAYNSLRDHIDQELEKSTTLVILDGLDERTGACKEILSQAQTGSHKLLMLSRPYDIDTERRLADIEIEHTGFNDEQLQAYVLAEVPDGKLAEELLGYIHRHENIRTIVHVPVNLQILCALWQDEGYDVREVAQQGSLPGLYRLITDFTWQRYTKKWGLEYESKEELFDTLGQIGLAALQKGEVLISPGLVDHYAKQETVKAKLKDANFLLLQYVGADAGRQQGFYEFPHLTFQEYFAGRALAQRFLSRDEDEREEASEFVSKHKYESQYGRTLTFMAGEVSRLAGVEGIKKLLSLLEEGDKEIVGLQHLRLQLRVVHEWLCMAGEDTEDELAALEEKFEVLSSLEAWFGRAFTHVRQGGYGHNSTGRKLLELLTSSLQTFGSVASHVLGLFELLLKATEDADRNVRRAAIEALLKVAHSAPSETSNIIPALSKATEDADRDVRRAAIEALLKVAHSAPSETSNIIPALLKATEDADRDVRRAAIEALLTVAQIAPSEAPNIIEILLLAAKDQNVRQATIETLVKVAHAAPSEAPNIVQALLLATKGADRDVRRAAIEALLKVAHSAPSETSNIIPALLKATKDADREVRRAAIKGLLKIVISAPSEVLNIIPVLLQATKDADREVRRAAIKGLLKIVISAPSEVLNIIPALLKATKDADREVQRAAIEALLTVAQIAPSEAPNIIETLLLAAKDQNVQRAAIETLVKVVEAAPQQAPRIRQILTEAVKDKVYWIRRAAFEGLESLVQAIPGQALEIRQILIEAAKDKAHWVRSSAVKILLKVFKVDPKQAPAILPTLIEAAKDADSFVRNTAQEALVKVVQAAPQKVLDIRQELIEAAKDPKCQIRRGALEDLGSLVQAAPQEAPAILPSLIDAAKDEDSRVRRNATEALIKIVKAAPDKAPTIIPTLQDAVQNDEDEDVRQDVIYALAKVVQITHSEISNIIPILVQAAKDKNSDIRIRKAALEALVKVIETAPHQAPAVIPTLQDAAKNDEDEDVRQGAIYALAKVAHATPSQAPIIISALIEDAKYSPGSVPKAAQEALVKVLEATSRQVQAIIPILTGAAEDNDPFVRRTTREVLIKVIQAAPQEALVQDILPALQAIAKDEDKNFRAAACKTLARVVQTTSQEAPAIIPTLQDVAKNDEDENVRQDAIYALVEVAQIAPSEVLNSIPILVEAAKDKNSDIRIRKAALEALIKVVKTAPSEAPAIIPTLQDATKDADREVQRAAIEALLTVAKIAHSEVSNIIQILVEAAKDKNSDVRIKKAALEALVKVVKTAPSEAPAIIPTLQDATKDADREVQRAAIEALLTVAKIAHSEVSNIIQILVEAAKDKNSDVRIKKAALEVLVKVVETALHQDSATIQTLQDTAKDATKALIKMVEAAPHQDSATIQTLQNTAKNEDEDVRQDAIYALAKVVQIAHSEVSNIIPILVKAAKDKNSDVSKAALEALVKIVEVVEMVKAVPLEATAIIKRLIEAAKDSDSFVRSAVRKALVKVVQIAPSEATTIIKRLIEAAKDSDSSVRSTVRKILAKVVQSAPGQYSDILHTLEEAAGGADSWGRLAALEALAPATLQQLLESYWATQSRDFIPCIKIRLYHTPLVVYKLPQRKRQVVLYDNVGSHTTWEKSEEVVEKLVQGLRESVESSSQDFAPAESSQRKGSYSSLSTQAEEAESPRQPATDNATSPSELGAALMHAAKNDDLDQVQSLVQQGAPTNQVDDEGRLPFMVAAQAGHLEVAKLLAQQITAEDMEQLLKRSPDLVNERYTKDKYTLLHIAILAKNEVVASVLTKNDSADLEIQDDYGRTPLLLAAEENLPGVVQHLLTKGVYVDTKDNYGHTPMYAAVKNGQPQMARLLLEKGADVKVRDKYGCTACTLAEIEWHRKVMDLLECSTVDPNCEEVCQAVESRDLDSIRNMLAPEGISITQEIEGLKEVIDLIEAQHCKKVCQAVESKDLDSIRSMLEQKEISITQALDGHENTLLYLAIQNDWNELARFVIDFIVDQEDQKPEIMHDPKFTPLHWAVAAGKKSMVQLLIRSKLTGSKRVDLEREDKEGQTALQLAIRKQQTGIEKLLLAEAAEPTPQPAPDAAVQESREAATLDTEISQDSPPAASSQPNEPQPSLQPVLGAATSPSKLEEDLMAAAKNGDLDTAQSLVQQGASADQVDNTGQLPFMAAAQAGHLEVAKFLAQQATAVAMEQLLKKSPGLINKQYKDGYTLLHIAILAENVAIASMLTKNDSADLEIKDDYGRTPLLLAAEGNLLGVAQHLLRTKDKGVDVNTEDDYGHTPMHAAAKNGHRHLAELLLENKATIEAQDECQNTPLHWAAREGRKEVVELLLENGADIKATDEYGRTARTLAEIEWHVKVKDLLEHSTVEQHCEEVCKAMENRDLDSIKDMLAQKGISITQETEGEIKGLKEIIDSIEAQNRRKACQAVERRDLDSIRDMLAQENISITQALDDRENTLLHLAIQDDWAELARFVIGFIIDHEPAIMCDPKFTPLHWAVAAGKTSMVQLLTSSKLIGSKRVELECKDDEGQTALLLAIRKRQVGITEALLASKAYVDTKDDYQRTPMHAVAQVGDLAMAKLLFRYKASFELQDEQRHTPLHWAAREGHVALVKFFVSKGADLQAEDEYGRTPLALAEMEERQEVTAFLKKCRKTKPKA